MNQQGAEVHVTALADASLPAAMATGPVGAAVSDHSQIAGPGETHECRRAANGAVAVISPTPGWSGAAR